MPGALPITRSSRTLAEQTYDTLKGDLLAGAFAPGAALLTRDLLERYRAIRLVRGDTARLVRDVAAEHRALADATIARAAAAVDLLAAHLERTRAFVAGVLQTTD